MNMHTGVPLKEFMSDKKQEHVADLLGVTQGSVSQMLRSEREIWVRQLPDGGFRAFEIRPIGRRSGQQQAA